MGPTVVTAAMVAMVEAALATTMPDMVATAATVDTGVMVHTVASETSMADCWILLTMYGCDDRPNYKGDGRWITQSLFNKLFQQIWIFCCIFVAAGSSSYSGYCPQDVLTHRGRDKVAIVFQTAIWNTFHSLVIFVLLFKFQDVCFRALKYADWFR